MKDGFHEVIVHKKNFQAIASNDSKMRTGEAAAWKGRDPAHRIIVLAIRKNMGDTNVPVDYDNVIFY